MAEKVNSQSNKNTKKKKKKRAGRIARKVFLVLGILLSASVGMVAATFVHRGEKALGMINYDDSRKLDDIDLSQYQLSADTQIINILLVGADKNGDEQNVKGAERRSDSMMIATLDIKHQKLKLTSLMRDMYVAIPGYGNQKLNSAYSYGGIQLLYETVAQNFGVRVDGYAEVNFDSFVNVIDQIGGVEVTLTESEAKYLNETNAIKRKKYRNVKVGKQTLNGHQALGYCRIRHGDKVNGRYPGVFTASGKGDDFGRVERQRLTMQAIFDKVKGMNPTQVLDLAADILPGVTTDVPQDQIYSYLVAMVQMGTTKINQFYLPIDGSYTIENIGGQSVLAIDVTSNKSALKKFLYNS